MVLQLKVEECDVAILGGSLGGVAAALSALKGGLKVLLTDENAWIGGQVTSQAVSALDEHVYIENCPGSATYAAFRSAVRRYYRERYHAPAVMPDGSPLNPGNGWVSGLCFEPQVGLKVLEEMLAPYVQTGQLKILRRHRPVRCEGDPSKIVGVEVCSPRGDSTYLRARTFLDATELGDLLPLAGVPYVSGAEAWEDTREPHASRDGPHPGRVQSFSVCFLVQYCPGENHTIKKPAGYARMRNAQPYSLTLINHQNQAVPYNFFTSSEDRPLPFWTYRRAFSAGLLKPAGGGGDIALINWPSNDYRWGNLIDQSQARKAEVLCAAVDLSRGFLYWLQTEAPRDDRQGYGYPELQILPAATGTRSGFAQAPYVRESRRIISLRRIVEQDIVKTANAGKKQASFPDSIGIGWYPMDLHACVGYEQTMFEPTLPFQIPLGALIPRECSNLIAACKNIGTTHLTNGSYRLHPVEWAIGEAAGLLAAYSQQEGVTPQQVWANPEYLRNFQALIREGGGKTEWPEEILLD